MCRSTATLRSHEPPRTPGLMTSGNPGYATIRQYGRGSTGRASAAQRDRGPIGMETNMEGRASSDLL